MQTRQSLGKKLARCGIGLAVSLAGAPALPAPSAENQQWECSPGAEGGWRCALVPRPESPFGHAPRLDPRPLTARPAAGEDAADLLADNMDWVPRAALSEEQTAAIGVQCAGAYVEPPIEAPAEDGAVIGTIHASAAESELLQDPEIAKFSGDVTLRQDDRRLRADVATYYREEERVEIEGNVQYREPGLLARGESAEFNTAERTGRLRKARFVMHGEHVRGKADQVIKNADDSVDLEDGTYTQCDPTSNAWRLAASTIHLDRSTGQGTARNARFEVKEVPVMYTPYIRFPIDDRRMSGFLWPVFTNSSQNGFDLALPYYLNLAPNYDATLIPRYMDKRGPMAGGEFRYLNRWSSWSASGAYLPDDNVYEDDRWLTNLQHLGAPLPKLRTRIDYTEVSDEDYLKNLSTTGLQVKRSTHLAQTGEATYRVGDAWLLRARAHQFQVLDEALDEPYKMLPRIELSRGFTRGAYQPDYALTTEFTAFEHKDAGRITGQRLYAEPQLGYPMEWTAGFVKPTVAYQYIGYNLDEGLNGTSDDSPSVSAPRASLDAGYFLERDSGMFGGNFLQTLEPRVYYLWSDYDDHADIPNFDSSDLTFSFSQLFRNTRFSGHDRIADANQTSVSVTSRLIDNETGVELLSASIGQIYYHEDRRVTISNQPQDEESGSDSPVAAEIQFSPIRDLQFTGTTLWDTSRDRVEEGGLMMHWTPGSQAIVNLGYRYRREGTGFVAPGNDPYADIDQADFSTVLPVGTHWKLIARYQYDFDADDSLEELAGVEYASCCWAVRMVYQEGVDWDNGRDRGFYLQFLLRGLGGLGQNIDQLLRNSIFGYTENRENNGFLY